MQVKILLPLECLVKNQESKGVEQKNVKNQSKPKEWKFEELWGNSNFLWKLTYLRLQAIRHDVEEGCAVEYSQEGCVWREDQGGDKVGSHV